MKTVLRYVLAVVIVSLVCSGCTIISTAWAMHKSTDHFVPHPADARIRYEPGAEPLADVLSAALPDAIATIELAQYRPFAAPVQVYACASIESFEAYGATSGREGGFVLNERLFISPKPENTPERLPRLLTHELSHLHLEQQLGLLRMARLPFWFKEGLAVYVSGGGGAENATPEDARIAIRHGRVFLPEVGSLFAPKLLHDYDLAPHLFYRQASLFIGYLKQTDEAAFKALLLGLHERPSFATAFEEVYGQTIEKVWEVFVREIETADS